MTIPKLKLKKKQTSKQFLKSKSFSAIKKNSYNKKKFLRFIYRLKSRGNKKELKQQQQKQSHFSLK